MRIAMYHWNLTFCLAASTMAGKDEEQYQWYTTTVGKCNFTLPTRYQELTSIGQGAFGVVM